MSRTSLWNRGAVDQARKARASTGVKTRHNYIAPGTLNILVRGPHSLLRERWTFEALHSRDAHSTEAREERKRERGVEDKAIGRGGSHEWHHVYVGFPAQRTAAS